MSGPMPLFAQSLQLQVLFARALSDCWSAAGSRLWDILNPAQKEFFNEWYVQWGRSNFDPGFSATVMKATNKTINKAIEANCHRTDELNRNPGEAVRKVNFLTRWSKDLSESDWTDEYSTKERLEGALNRSRGSSSTQPALPTNNTTGFSSMPQDSGYAQPDSLPGIYPETHRQNTELSEVQIPYSGSSVTQSHISTNNNPRDLKTPSKNRKGKERSDLEKKVPTSTPKNKNLTGTRTPETYTLKRQTSKTETKKRPRSSKSNSPKRPSAPKERNLAPIPGPSKVQPSPEKRTGRDKPRSVRGDKAAAADPGHKPNTPQAQSDAGKEFRDNLAKRDKEHVAKIVEAQRPATQAAIEREIKEYKRRRHLEKEAKKGAHDRTSKPPNPQQDSGTSPRPSGSGTRERRRSQTPSDDKRADRGKRDERLELQYIL